MRFVAKYFCTPPDVFLRLESVTIPSADPRLASLGKRLETCRPIGIFRSKEHEFLLCYAGQLSSHENVSILTLPPQNSAYMSINRAIPVVPLAPLSGKAVRTVLLSTRHTFCCSTHGLSKSVTSRQGDSLKLSLVTMSAAFGMAGASVQTSSSHQAMYPMIRWFRKHRSMQ